MTQKKSKAPEPEQKTPEPDLPAEWTPDAQPPAATVPDGYAIPLDPKTGEMQPRTVGDMVYLAKVMFESRLVSESFQSPQAVFIALQTAKERGVSPMTMIQNSYVVKNRLRTYGGFPKALVMRSGKCAEYDEWTEDEEGQRICKDNKNLKAKPFFGMCRTKRADNGWIEETTFSMDDAQQADLLRKDNWRKYPGRMLLSKARMHNLEYQFADVVGGLLPHDDSFGEDGPPSSKAVEQTNEEKDLAEDLP